MTCEMIINSCLLIPLSIKSLVDYGCHLLPANSPTPTSVSYPQLESCGQLCRNAALSKLLILLDPILDTATCYCITTQPTNYNFGATSCTYLCAIDRSDRCGGTELNSFDDLYSFYIYVAGILHGFHEKLYCTLFSGAARISVRGGEHSRGVGLVGGPGAEPPGRQKILKISKKFLMKIAKMDYFRRFFKKAK